jgi:prephenate dehydratase
MSAEAPEGPDAEVFAYLGPRGTFAEAALRALPRAAGATLVPYQSVQATLDAARAGEVTAALVPIENSVEGSVPLTLDELAAGAPLVIADEVALPVRFALVARPGTTLGEVKRVATHPHAQAQCRGWLSANLPGVPVVPAMSTAGAAAALVADDAPYDAAITQPIAAEVYGLDVLASDIGDNEDAWTRFVLVRPPGHVPPATGADKTTLVLFMREDHPGALLEILTEFAVRGVNLTRIESRPTKKALGDYYFSVDCEGHVDDARVGEALMGLHRVCAQVRFLGSYARHDGREPIVRRGVTDADFTGAQAWLARVRDGRGD